MAYQDLIGNPLITGIIAAASACFIVAWAWILISLRGATPELLQLMTFQSIGILRRAILALSLSILLQEIFLAIFFADFGLPIAVLATGGAASAILFWYAVYLYARALHVPRASRHLALER